MRDVAPSSIVIGNMKLCDGVRAASHLLPPTTLTSTTLTSTTLVLPLLAATSTSKLAFPSISIAIASYRHIALCSHHEYRTHCLSPRSSRWQHLDYVVMVIFAEVALPSLLALLNRFDPLPVIGLDSASQSRKLVKGFVCSSSYAASEFQRL